MASFVAGGSVVFLIYLFNKNRNPDYLQLKELTSAQIHGHKIFTGHNRVSVPGKICNCDGPNYGFSSKVETDKYSSNNWLSCQCRRKSYISKNRMNTVYPIHNNPDVSVQDTVFPKDFSDECKDASHGSCYNYQRKMAGINNKNAKYPGERMDHLKWLNETKPKRCQSVIGFTPKPRCDSCHSVQSSGKINNANNFYNF